MTLVVTLHLNWQEQTFSFFLYQVLIYYTTRPAFVPLLIFPSDSNSSDQQEVGTHCELSHACELSVACVLCLPLSSFLCLSISLDWSFSLNLHVASSFSCSITLIDRWIEVLHYVVRLIVKLLLSILLYTLSHRLTCICMNGHKCLNWVNTNISTLLII